MRTEVDWGVTKSDFLSIGWLRLRAVRRPAGGSGADRERGRAGGPEDRVGRREPESKERAGGGSVPEARVQEGMGVLIFPS